MQVELSNVITIAILVLGFALQYMASQREKMKDAVERGKLEQRVSDLEKETDKNETTKDKLDKLIASFERFDERVSGIDKKVDDLKRDVEALKHCE